MRRGLLHAEWRRIAALLATRFDGLADRLPPLADRPSGIDAKAHEDMLDAIVCAWVGVTALDGQAEAYGDDDFGDLGAARPLALRLAGNRGGRGRLSATCRPSIPAPPP